MDEGHRIKNAVAGLTKALATIRTHRRIVLTGYPLQNNLMEYYHMVNFVRPHFLGSVGMRIDAVSCLEFNVCAAGEFRNMFVNPISNGQHADSTMEDIRRMRYRVHVLRRMLTPFVQRCVCLFDPTQILCRSVRVCCVIASHRFVIR